MFVSTVWVRTIRGSVSDRALLPVLSIISPSKWKLFWMQRLYFLNKLFACGGFHLLPPGFFSTRLQLPDQQEAGSYISFHRIYYLFSYTSVYTSETKMPMDERVFYLSWIINAFQEKKEKEKPDSSQTDMHSCRHIYFLFVLHPELKSSKAKVKILVLT